MDFLIFFSNTAAGWVRSAVCLILISRLVFSEKPKKRERSVMAAGILVVSVLLTLAGAPDFYRIASETALLTVCAGRFLRTDIRISLFLSIFYEIAVFLWQFLFGAWAGILFGSPDFLDLRTGSGQLAVWVLHLLLAALAWYLLKHPDRTAEEIFRPASGIAAAGLLAVISISEQTFFFIADDTLDTWIILAVVFLMSVLLFHLKRQYEVEKELARLKSEQAEWLERDYITLNNIYEVHAKLFHDLHNHIGVLRQLLLQEKTEEALSYLNQLQTPVQEITHTVWTGDETVDYLINSKAVSAKENGIRYQVQVEFPRHTNLSSADLCALLGNLLDNALEAAKQLPAEKQPFLELTIRRINQMLIIKVENSFLTAPIEKDGTIITSKNQMGLHGWGLKSARTAVEKYDGILQTSYTEHTFLAVATLSFQCCSAKTHRS